MREAKRLPYGDRLRALHSVGTGVPDCPSCGRRNASPTKGLRVPFIRRGGVSPPVTLAPNTTLWKNHAFFPITILSKNQKTPINKRFLLSCYDKRSLCHSSLPSPSTPRRSEKPKYLSFRGLLWQAVESCFGGEARWRDRLSTCGMDLPTRSIALKSP